MSIRVIAGVVELQGLVGQEIGISPWRTVEQDRVDHFADATDDHQWIHVDAERASTGPFASTIAHGYLTLSLIPALVAQAYRIEGVGIVINYGLNRVRFPHAVLVGSRIRSRSRVTGLEQRDASTWQMTVEQTVELEGAPRPACVAQTISLLRVATSST